MVELVKRSALRWMGRVLRREDDEPVKRVWYLEVDGVRENGRPKISCKDMVKKESSEVGLIKDTQDKKKWREGVSSWRESQLPLVRGKMLTFINDDDDAGNHGLGRYY